MYLYVVATANKVCNSKGRTERLHIHRGIQTDTRQTAHWWCW